VGGESSVRFSCLGAGQRRRVGATLGPVRRRVPVPSERLRPSGDRRTRTVGHYSLAYGDGTCAEPVWVNRTLLAALRRVTSIDDSVVVLNWQHQAYRCRPHRVRGAEPPDETWPTEFYPSGDYYIWLADDFRYGTFGHPWEPSLCVFGEELLAVLAEIGDEALGRILRRNGSPAHAATPEQPGQEQG